MKNQFFFIYRIKFTKTRTVLTHIRKNYTDPMIWIDNQIKTGTVYVALPSFCVWGGDVELHDKLGTGTGIPYHIVLTIWNKE